MCAPLQLRSVLEWALISIPDLNPPPLSSRFDHTWAAWFSTFLFFGSSLKSTTCSAVPSSLPSSISYRYDIPAWPRMKPITSLWNGRVGCLAFCLRFMCSLERDERTFTDGGPYFHRRRLWMWTNALQPCWALLWFSDTCRRPLFLYDTLHPFLLWEYEHTCGQGLVIDGYIWKLPQCISIFLHMGSRKLLISSSLFFFLLFFCSVSQEQFLCHSGSWGEDWHSHLNHPKAAVAGYLELGLTENSTEQHFADAGTTLFTLFANLWKIYIF